MKLWLNKDSYIETEQGLDISIPLAAGPKNVNAWYCEPVRIEPVKTANFIGDVNQGSPVNFNNVRLNPHGNGTHTECVGHISTEKQTIHDCLKSFHFTAELITIQPKQVYNEYYKQSDFLITKEDLTKALGKKPRRECLVIRTLPNPNTKKTKQYSNTNPAYFTKGAMELIVAKGYKHLLVDLPSVDREVDDGALETHRIFWNYPENPLTHKTITELIYVPENIKDGNYLLNFQIISILNDASPSKIILHEIHRK
jgi:arylformamidase